MLVTFELGSIKLTVCDVLSNVLIGPTMSCD